jgi:hypothetical protein
MLEAGDINDNQILNATVQRTDARGLTQLRVNLPSGRLLCSEWITEDNKKPALRKWVEVVREQIVADATAQRRAKAQQSTPASTGTAPSSASSTPSTVTAAADSLPSAGPDPLEMAKAQVARLDSVSKVLHNQIRDWTSKWTEAQLEMKRWQKVVDTLEEFG